MKTSDFDYDLPPELIAQEPLPDRSASRMMVLDRQRSALAHHGVSELPDMLCAGDLLVVNDTRVIPARVFGYRADTGGRAELLLLEQLDSSSGQEQWSAFYRASGRARPGLVLELANGQLQGEISEVRSAGRIVIALRSDSPVLEVLEREGVPPVPPYIHRDADGRDPRVELDRQRYQTVYARVPGAVAAPTAGLHLTEGLLNDCRARGVETTFITLHVGPGTFQPVKAARVADHHMEAERYAVPQGAAAAIEKAKAQGGRVVAVGSTVVRTLETVARTDGAVAAGEGRSDIFIRPPYQFRAVDALLTNFHLPCSTLLMMVSALAGVDFIRRAYAEAVAQRYRFYSYGDCMLIV